MSEPNLPVPPELKHLSTFIDTHIECLAGSSNELRSIALCAAKFMFDWALETEKSSYPHLETLLATLIEAAPPQTRSQTRNTPTQKSSPSLIQRSQQKIDIWETPLPSLFTEGMNIDQIWQQLDLRAARICEYLQALQGEDETEGEKADLAGEVIEADESEDDDDAAEMDIDDPEDLWKELSSGEEDDSSTVEVVDNPLEGIPEDDEDHGLSISRLGILRSQQKLNASRPYSRGHSGLDDGFFDLATFHAETSEVDAEKAAKRKSDFVADDDSAEESEVDLFGSVDDSETGAADDLAPTALFYNDFFEPPLRVQNGRIRSSKVRFHERVSVKKIKPVGKGLPVSSMDDEDSEEDEDEEEEGDEEDEEESDFGDKSS